MRFGSINVNQQLDKALSKSETTLLNTDSHLGVVRRESLEIIFRFFHDPVKYRPNLTILSSQGTNDKQNFIKIPTFPFGGALAKSNVGNILTFNRYTNHAFIANRNNYAGILLKKDEEAKFRYWIKWFSCFGDQLIYREIERRVVDSDRNNGADFNKKYPLANGSKRLSGAYPQNYYDTRDITEITALAGGMLNSFINARAAFIQCYSVSVKDGLSCPDAGFIKRPKVVEDFITKHMGWVKDELTQTYQKTDIETDNVTAALTLAYNAPSDMEMKVSTAPRSTENRVEKLVEEIQSLQKELKSEQAVDTVVGLHTSKSPPMFTGGNVKNLLKTGSMTPSQSDTPTVKKSSSGSKHCGEDVECRKAYETLRRDSKYNSWDVKSMIVEDELGESPGLRWFKNGDTKLRVNSAADIENYIDSDPPKRDKSLFGKRVTRPTPRSTGRKNTKNRSTRIGNTLVAATLTRFRVKPERGVSFYKRVNSQFGPKQRTVNDAHLNKAFRSFQRAHSVHSMMKP